MDFNIGTDNEYVCRVLFTFGMDLFKNVHWGAEMLKNSLLFICEILEMAGREFEL